MSNRVLKIGIAGLGNVGLALVDLVQRQEALRLPGLIEIIGVCARDKHRKRSIDISTYQWFDDPVRLAAHPDLDIFVELMGGSEGCTKDSVTKALERGCAVVTANKALIAKHGEALSQMTEDNNANLLFEAAVGGGIPIIRPLRDSLAGTQINSISGILNGTCNFLLTEMLAHQTQYSDILARAQRLGYAEADPSLDVSGMDAAHKIAILAAIGFSAQLDFKKVSITGVDNIALSDLILADKLGYNVKLIAKAERSQNGVICSVAPLLLKENHPLYGISGVLNAVMIDADPVGALTFIGAGAGAGPTASAVMGDIARLFSPSNEPPFGVKSTLRQAVFAEPDNFRHTKSSFFMHLKLMDKPGVLAAVSEILAAHNVSIDSLLQDSADENGRASVAIVTHACSTEVMTNIVNDIAKLETLHDRPHIIRIESG